MNKQIKVLLILLSSLAINGQQSFTLSKAIDYALKNGQSLKMVQLDMADAHEQVNEYKSIGLPQLNGGVNYTYYFVTPSQPVQDFISPIVYGVLQAENLIDQGGIPTPETFDFSLFQKQNLTANLEFSQLLFDPSYITGLKAARLYKDLVSKSSAVAERDIRGNVTKAYFSILIAQENLNIIAKNIEVVSKSHSDAEQLYENGFVESLDVDRLFLSLENLKTEATNLGQLVVMSKNLLKYQMNYPIYDDLTLSENLEEVISISLLNDIDLLEDIDYNLRPEYDQLNTSQELNQLDLKRQKDGYWPSVRAFANASESLQRNNIFDSSESGWLPSAAAGVAIKLPIFDGNQRKSQIQRTKLRIEKTDLERSEFERGMVLQVQNARINFANAKRSLQDKNNALELNQKIYDKTMIKFNEGVGSSVEVSQAEASLYQAQSAYINALYDLVLSKTDLDLALGNL